jgi:hypothetical protein
MAQLYTCANVSVHSIYCNSTGALSSSHAITVWCSLQIINDIERTKNEIAAADKRQQEVVSQVQQAKQGKEDSVSIAADC